MRGEGSLGDSILSTPCYRGIKQANPQIKLTVACFGTSYEFLKDNPYIDEIFKLPVKTRIRHHQRWPSLIWAGLQLRCKHFDLILDTCTRITWNWKLCKWLAGGNRVLDCFTSPVELEPSKQHACEYEASVLKHLGVENPTTDCDIPIPSINRQRVGDWLNQHQIDNYILLNPTGSVEARCFSKQTIADLCEQLKPFGLPLVVPSMPSQETRWKAVFKHYPQATVITTPNVRDLFEVIRRATFVITPDTSVVHAACGLKKITLAFYNLLYPHYSPGYSRAIAIQTAPESVNGIDWTKVTQALAQIKQWLAETH